MNVHHHSPARSVTAALLWLAAAWLAGCASIPEPLRGGPEQSPDPVVVRAAPAQYAGSSVRWGGVIVTVENGPTESMVQVVSRPLANSARPLLTDESSGRFIARIDGFIDPVDYAAGREITVVGVLEGVEQQQIGSYGYRFPLVRATRHYLWPLRPPPLPDPYFYSPFYRPWYPYGPYPYGPYPYW